MSSLVTPEELRGRAEDCECTHCKAALRAAADRIEALERDRRIGESYLIHQKEKIKALRSKVQSLDAYAKTWAGHAMTHALAVSLLSGHVPDDIAVAIMERVYSEGTPKPDAP